MNPTNPIFALLALLFAVVPCFFIAKKISVREPLRRYNSIDGLRGHLAFAVFLHHSIIWYFYLHTGKWAVPPSNFYTNLGQASVVLFFMITGFLFYTKIIENRNSGLDWTKFYLSRLLRLVPLYLFAMFLLFLIIIYRSNATLNEPALALAKNLMKWLGFTILGAPGLNGFSDTWIVMAGVTWSLPYEWFFYFALPLLALTVRAVPPTPYLIFSMASVVFAVKLNFEVFNLLAFGGGIFAALAVRHQLIRNIATSKIASPLLMTSFVIVISFFPTTYGYIQLALISVCFTLIAGGCNLYGLFTNIVSTTLGEMAYSIYLIHGIILFTVIDLIIGIDNAIKFSPLSYWLLIISLTPIVVFTSFTSFMLIERPLMTKVTTFNIWLHSKFSQKPVEPAIPARET